ncbi:unnamed protein product [Adineta steineri]|uniref:G-protein coupled receptors family 2 profile 2 domain-containing protein n=1 Tax=Adineta steineri TaxID=433720 RepID=A0A818WY21_9BILA|nr:unnamed protein product [Adineta steineri]CAF3731145.1 unnamed protein product [Adineta steineri]
MHAIIFLVFFLLNSTIAVELSCLQRDSCNGTLIDQRSMYMNDSQIIKDRNCFCDKFCFQYDDCCEDIKDYQIKTPTTSKATCIDYMYPFRKPLQEYEPTVMPVWMITNCSSNYKYTELEQNCTDYNDENLTSTHLSAFIPMTSRKTNLTYRNIYCALCNNEKIHSLIDWSFHFECDDFNQTSTLYYTYGLNIKKLLSEEGDKCTARLRFPPAPAIIHPCKEQTINSCPNSSNNQTLNNLCSTVNAYRYVTAFDPNHGRNHSLYRNEYCLICHNITDFPPYVESSCEHQLDDELFVHMHPTSGGSHGMHSLSVLFDPTTFSNDIPQRSLSDYRYHSSYQTHFTPFYPCSYYEVYDYLLHRCIILQNKRDWDLVESYNCTNSVLIHYENIENDRIKFLSYELFRQQEDYIVLFSDSRKLIICGERYPLLYIHHNHFITAIRYLSTIISLVSLLIFIVSYNQKSVLHNLPGKCLLMLSISLHISQSMFLISGHLVDDVNRLWCIGSGIGVHLFYLSTFAWLTAISFDTCRTLTRMNRLDERVARSRFILYNILVWTFSISIVFISVCFQLFLSKSSRWSPNYGLILCSISSRYALLTFFLIPNGFLILLNILFFTRTVIVIHRIDRETHLARCATRGNDRSRCSLYFRLALLMGLHWVFLVVCIIFKHDLLWLLFDVVNSLPGLFIAVGFLRKQSSLSDLKAKYRSSQSQLSSMGIASNTMSTKNTSRSMNSSADASPNVQMYRKFDDITKKFDKLTRQLLRPDTYLSTSSFHRSANSL